MSIYAKAVRSLVEDSCLTTEDRVLVLCGGPTDRQVFLDNDFTNVVISNLEPHDGVTDFQPYEWERYDAEDVGCEDGSFDWVFVHAGLHHCASPHRGLCEMLRVARKGVGVFEARDSLLVRLGIRVGLVPEYELEPVALSDGAQGGLRNSAVPNYVYRWTESEVEKTVRSYLPQYENEFRYFYGYLVPTQRLAMSPRLWKRLLARCFGWLVPVAERVLPSQGNQFGFIVTKARALKPWLVEKDGQVLPDLDYLEQRFRREKYRKL